MKSLVVSVILLVAAVDSIGRTADDWFRLVAEINMQSARLDRTDQKFIRYMLNSLSVDEDAYPTPAQQRWLLDIKRRLDRN
jgi:hypothetical protein